MGSFPCINDPSYKRFLKTFKTALSSQGYKAQVGS